MEGVFLSMVLMLSVFLGFELISKVPATLHTPLMSGANAISGITVVGALISAGGDLGGPDGHLGVQVEPDRGARAALGHRQQPPHRSNRPDH